MFEPHTSTAHLPSCEPMPRRPFSNPYAPCSLRGSRSEPVLYEELYFSLTLPRNWSDPDKGTVYVADATPDQSGANDSRLFRRSSDVARSGANNDAESPNSVMLVNAYVTPLPRLKPDTGVAHAVSNSAPLDSTLRIELTTNTSPLKVFNWKFVYC